MRILKDKTGKGQLEVLSALASEPGQRQSQIVEKTSLSKGAVSNNVRKLREKKLISGEQELSLDEERLTQLYREHIENFLIRDSEEPRELNELRTLTKRRISDIVEKKEVREVLKQVLSQSIERQDLESLNSVFKETDRVLRETTDNPEIKMMALTTDKSNTVTDNPKIVEEAQKIIEEVEQ